MFRKTSFALIYTIALSLIFAACQESNKKLKSDIPISRDAKYTKFVLPAFKALVVKCDRGRLKLTIRQFQYPRMEIHKSYQKYVNFENKGDTLFINTENTPPNTDKQVISKIINLYIPDINYLQANLSQITLMDFESRKLKVKNINNSLRLYQSKIQNLDIEANDLSNILLDENNFVENLQLSLSTESIYSSQAHILKKFTLRSSHIENANFKNIPPNGFVWVKEKPTFLK